MAKRRVTSNKALRYNRKIKKGAGPVYLYHNPPVNQKKKQGSNSVKPQKGCDGIIDNNVTYVFDLGPNGEHLAYVDCDYVD